MRRCDLAPCCCRDNRHWHILESVYDPSSSYAPGSILKTATCMALLPAPEPSLAAAALAAFGHLSLREGPDAAPCKDFVTYAPQRLWAAMRRPDVVLAAEAQMPGCAAIAVYIFHMWGDDELEEETGVDAMAAAALPATLQTLAGAGAEFLSSVAGPAAATVLHHATHANRQPSKLRQQLLRAVCRMTSALAAAAAAGRGGRGEAGGRNLGRSINQCQKAAHHLLPKEVPTPLIRAAAGDLLATAAALMPIAMLQTVQPFPADAYLSFERGLCPALPLAPADAQLALFSAAVAALGSAVPGLCSDGQQQIAALSALPALAACVGAVIKAPAVAQAATAASLSEVGRLMTEALCQCGQLQPRGRGWQLLQRNCPAATRAELPSNLGGSLRVTQVLAAACLAEVLQRLSAAAAAATPSTATRSGGGGGGAAKGSVAAAAAADAFQELSNAGAVTALAATLRELSGTEQWAAPADAHGGGGSCQRCSQIRLRLVSRQEPLAAAGRRHCNACQEAAVELRWL